MSLRNLITYLAAQNPSLFVDEVTARFVDRGKLLALDEQEFNTFLASLSHGLKKQAPSHSPIHPQQAVLDHPPDVGGGTINLAELSLLTDLSFQADSFTLATLLFDGTALGTSPLALSDVILGDAWGDPLEATLESSTVTVRSGNNVVPEPATMLLVGTGLAGFAGMRRRFGK